MFHTKDSQRSLFETHNLVPAAKQRRLQASWAETFRTRALPLIDETQFAPLYCDDNGRPNQPVQTVFGVLLLKEMFALTDAEALEQLEFSLLWQHALELTPEEAHLAQKTLHNFRARLLAHDRGRAAFEATTDRILRTLGTKVTRQRLDSTHVISHIAVLTRLGLFCETIRHVLKRLAAQHPRVFRRVPERMRRRYLKKDGSATAYQDAPSGTGKRRLSVMPVLKALDERGQRPQELVADTAYGSGDNAVAAERLGTEWVSPVKGPPVDVEERPATVTKADFRVDARLEDPAICPAGHFATRQTPWEHKPHHVVLTFERRSCESCALFGLCPARPNPDGDGYVVTVDLKAANLERRRRDMASGAFRPRYRIRAGIEATISELKRKHGLGALRVRGRGRVELAVYLKALACNVKRMVRALESPPTAISPAMG